MRRQRELWRHQIEQKRAVSREHPLQSGRWNNRGLLWLTEKLLALSSLVLNHLDDSRSERLDRRNVVGQDTHIAGCCGEVDLGDTGRREEGLGGVSMNVQKLWSWIRRSVSRDRWGRMG